MKISFKRGFTLLELLVVVAIIGLLSAVVLAALNSARSKGSDAGVQSNLKNAMAQGEIFYNTNTMAINTYTNVCSTTSPIGGANTVTAFVTAAAKDSGLGSYTTNGTGAVGSATCNSTANNWAAEVPLTGKGPNQMWCVDNIGESRQENNLSILAGTDCP
jgi:prepilin-type N-terminal cleavage/methylation domain-containing protein